MHEVMHYELPSETQNELTQLGRAFDHLHGLVDNHVFLRMSTSLRGGEFSFSQLNALYRLYRFGPQTIAELARGAALSQAAASRMVERLVQNGLVERNEMPSDRRSKLVELTQAGTGRLQDLQAFTVQMYSGLLEPLPLELRRRLAAVLAELRPFLPTHPLQQDSE